MSQHIVDLTQEAEEGSQENPHDLTHEELQDLEELAVIEARTRAAGYGAVHTEGADEDLPQDLRATYTNLPAATPGQEQNRDFELKDGTFMRVIGRARDSRHEEWIIGRRLYPQHAPGLLMPQPRTRDELVWLSYCDKDRDEYGRNVRVRARDVRRKCKIIFTNAPHQVLNSALVRNGQDNLFFCRWRRMITLPENSANGPINGHKAGTIENIGVESADPESIELRDGRLMSASTATAEIRKRFRGTENCDLGGDTLGEDDSGTFIQKYSFADFFCGAGGASQGALDADLSLRLALDHDEVAILTYKTNFARPGLDIREVDISEFIRNHRAEEGRRWIVDVLHASPPCQPFSPANTTPNMARNAINEASLTMVFDILVICKPRMVTIEETEGILRPRHRDFFQGLISYFIDHGYSVHWRAIDMKRYGVPQTRKRLILIASGCVYFLLSLRPGLKFVVTVLERASPLFLHPHTVQRLASSHLPR